MRCLMHRLLPVSICSLNTPPLCMQAAAGSLQLLCCLCQTGCQLPCPPQTVLAGRHAGSAGTPPPAECSSSRPGTGQRWGLRSGHGLGPLPYSLSAVAAHRASAGAQHGSCAPTGQAAGNWQGRSASPGASEEQRPLADAACCRHDWAAAWAWPGRCGPATSPERHACVARGCCQQHGRGMGGAWPQTGAGWQSTRLCARPRAQRASA